MRNYHVMLSCSFHEAKELVVTRQIITAQGKKKKTSGKDMTERECNSPLLSDDMIHIHRRHNSIRD